MNLDEYLKTGQSTQQELADQLGVTQSMICQWSNWCQKKKNNASRITAERAIQIEKATKGVVTRHDLRPDVFGRITKRAA